MVSGQRAEIVEILPNIVLNAFTLFVLPLDNQATDYHCCLLQSFLIYRPHHGHRDVLRQREACVGRGNAGEDIYPPSSFKSSCRKLTLYMWQFLLFVGLFSRSAPSLFILLRWNHVLSPRTLHTLCSLRIFDAELYDITLKQYSSS